MNKETLARRSEIAKALLACDGAFVVCLEAKDKSGISVLGTSPPNFLLHLALSHLEDIAESLTPEGRTALLGEITGILLAGNPSGAHSIHRSEGEVLGRVHGNTTIRM